MTLLGLVNLHAMNLVTEASNPVSQMDPLLFPQSHRTGPSQLPHSRLVPSLPPRCLTQLLATVSHFPAGSQPVVYQKP